MASFRPHRGKIQAIIRRKGRRPITKAFPTKAAAQVWAREIETAIDRDELPVAVQRRGDKRTFGDICIRYRDDVSPWLATGRTGRPGRIINRGNVQSGISVMCSGAKITFR